MSDPFFITLLGHLADELTERGYDLLLSRVIPADDNWLARLVDSGRVDGTIVIGQSDQIATLNRVAARYAPLIVWGQAIAGDAYCSIGTDNHAGGALATAHLLSRGRRRLLFVGTPDIPEIAARHAGFLAAHAEAGVAPAGEVAAHLTADAAYEAIRAHLAGGAAIDGIVAVSDVVAMSALRALSEHGVRVPEDVAVTGYDDVSLAAHTTPPLTTVRQDLATAARLLVDRVVARIAGEQACSAVLPPELVVRAST